MRTFITFCAIVAFHLAGAQQSERSASLDSLVRPYIKPNAPGLSIGVVENGKLIYARGIGLANLETLEPNDSSSVFGIASLAKQLTAACIWSLIQDNKLSLDDDIRTYIPEFPDYGKKIRIRHMLNHTSGIRNYHAIMDLAGFDYDREYHDNQTILELACRQKALNHAPGEKVVYGNTAYTLLAIIVERITGQSLDEYARNNLFLPLGMNQTFYRTSLSAPVAHKSLGYVEREGGGYEHVIANQITYGAGSVGSSVVDLAIWSNVLNGLDPDYLDLTRFLTTTEVLGSGEKAKYARGVMVDEYKGLRTVHHSGYSQSGQSWIIAVPESKLAVIILTNLESINPSPLAYQVLDLFISKQVEESSVTSAGYSHKSEELKNYVGHYQEQHSDMRMEILLENDTLKAWGSQGRMPIPLKATGRGTFVRASNAGVLYDFTSAKKANADLMVFFGGTPFYFSKAEFVNPREVVLTDYVGIYHSDELSVDYRFSLENNELVLDYPNHAHTRLTPGQKDEFGNGQRVLYHFVRDQENKVVKLLLSAEGTVKDIEFVRK